MATEVAHLVHAVQVPVEVVREGGEEAEASVAREELSFLWRHLGADHALLAHLAPHGHGRGVLEE